MTAARRSLADLICEVVGGTLDALAAAPELTVERVALSLPVEIAVRRTGGVARLDAELPRALTRTDFDVPPGRLDVVWVAEKSS